jgi:hypothetical protein
MADVKALVRPSGQVRDSLDADKLLIGGVDYGIAGGTLTLGTVNATALSIGSIGVTATVLGNLSVNGIFTIVDGGSMFGDGNITLGGGDGDTITLGGSWVSADDIVNIGTVNGVHNTTVNLRCSMGVGQDKRINFDRTADSEGAILLPDTKDVPVGLAMGMIRVNAAGFFEWYNGAAWVTAVTTAYTLDDAYSAGLATITVDAYDVTWNLTGAFSFVTNLAGCTGAADGFFVEDGTDYFKLMHKGADALAATGQFSSLQLDSAADISLDAVSSSNFTISANSAGAELLTIRANQAGAGTGSITVYAADDVGVTAAAGTLSLNGCGPLLGNGVAIEADVGGGAIAIGCNLGTNQVSLGGAGARNIFVGSTSATGLTLAAEQIGASISVNTAAIHTIGFSSLNAGAGTAVITFLADDAITLDSTAAGFSIDGITASNVCTTTGDLTLDSTAGKMYIGTGAGGQVNIGKSTREMDIAADQFDLVASGASGGLLIKINANVAATRDLALYAANANAAGARITFMDSYQAASTYSTSIPFSSAAAEWSSFETNFGEVSLLAALNACASTAVTLDEAYNAGVATITVDAYDTTWNLIGDYSFVLGLAGCTNAADGFQITNTADFLSILRADVAKLAWTSEFESFDLNVAGSLTIDSLVAVQVGTGAGGFTVNTTQLVMDQTTGYLGLGVAAPSGMIAMNGEAHRQMGVERRTAANTAGKNLSIGAGGATVGATDKAGGDLNLASGISTGTGSSGFNFYAYPSGIAGVADNVPIAMIQGTCALLTLGDTTGASATTIRTGTGAMTFTAGGIFDVNAVGAVSIDSSGGTIGIGVDANAFGINIGTGAAARLITIGNVTTTTGVAINTGTGDFKVNTDQFYVDQPTGYSGFGTNVPGERVDVLGTVRAYGGAYAINQSVTCFSGQVGGVWTNRIKARSDASGVPYLSIEVASDAANNSFEAVKFYPYASNSMGLGIGCTPVQRLNIQSGALRFDYVPTLSGAACTFADGAAGVNTAGVHSLKFTAVNSLGETELGTVSPNYTVATNEEKVVSNCPISPDPTVTSRNVYACKAGLTTWYLIAGLLPDNTTTSCTINVADADLVTAGPARNYTSGYLYAGTYRLFNADSAGNWCLGGTASTTVSGYGFLCCGSSGLIFRNAANTTTYGIISQATGYHGFGSGITIGGVTQLISLEGNTARQILLNRHTTSNTAGNNLSVIAGGATLLATDKAGGSLYLKPGQATGTGSAASSLWATPVGAAGTTTNDPVQVLTCGPLSGGAAGSIAVGVGTILPTSLLDLEITGTVKSVTDVLEITNRGNAADMDGTGTAILFNQWYYDNATPAVADAGRIAVVTETDWTSTATTQDASMLFQTAYRGTVATKATLDSRSNLTLTNTGLPDPDAGGCLQLWNAAAPTAHVDESIHVYSVDSSDGTATLGLMLEQAVEAIGAGFTPDFKLKLKIDGVEYRIALEAV